MNHSWNIEQHEASEGANCRRTILLVEDETFVREVMCEILQSVGYVVLSAKDAGEAEGIFIDIGPNIDLLLTDVLLPGETGRALAAKLRQERSWLKVLFVTGYADQWKALEDSGEECLAKPFSGAVLVARIGRMFDEPQTQREEEPVMPVGACA
jgi:DNA-binding response OmpR family regulator